VWVKAHAVGGLTRVKERWERWRDREKDKKRRAVEGAAPTVRAANEW